jgi:4-amino-4-deoxy-L-arabinose transferase-like glycosyltransferase
MLAPWRHISRDAWIALCLCAALLVLFAAMAYTAVLTKSATYDEPLHVVGGYLHLYDHDFRINPEDPALFGYWAALAIGPRGLVYDRHSPDLIAAADAIDRQWPFVINTLYRTPENDFRAIVARARFVFVLVGVGLGAVVAWWSYRLGGVIAAIMAAGLLAFDPNVLAHTALVKNDVPLALCLTGMMVAIWGFGRRGTTGRLLLIAVCCTAAVNVKYSGLLLGPIAAATLAIRAPMPGSWNVFNRQLMTRRRRLIAAAGACAVVAATVYIGTWASYGFRFGPTRDPRVRVDTQRTALLAAVNDYQARYGPPRSSRELQNLPMPLLPATLLWLENMRLLPQPWINGFIYTYATTRVRPAYLLGERSITGWRSYFPLAMLFKTPLATLSAAGLLLAAWVVRYALSRRRARGRAAAPDDSAQSPDTRSRFDAWAKVCIIVPLAIYGFSAITANLNLGLRHVLPMYPLLYVLMGVAAAGWVRRRRVLPSLVAAAIALGLILESVAAWPNYIPFFNVAFGGSRSGLRLLGDSNLDWGQDLPALAEWRARYPEGRLYLAYFGTAPPEAYGVEYINLRGGTPYAQPPQEITAPGIVALSASNVQGIYLPYDIYARFREEAEPFAVLGGSIYLYEFPIRPQ